MKNNCIARAIAVLAVLVLPTFGQVLKQPKLAWRSSDGTPTGDGIVDLAPRQRGAPERPAPTMTARALDPKMFRGLRTFRAAVEDVGIDMKYVYIIAGGTAKEDPEAGTIIDIGGAIIGFRRLANPSGGPMLAQICAARENERGERTWLAANYSVMLNADGLVSFPSSFCVQFGANAKTWSLWYKDVKLLDNLSLKTPAHGSTILSVRAGSAVDDVAIIKDVTFADGPQPRIGNSIRSYDNKIDLEMTRLSGNSDVIHNH